MVTVMVTGGNKSQEKHFHLYMHVMRQDKATVG